MEKTSKTDTRRRVRTPSTPSPTFTHDGIGLDTTLEVLGLTTRVYSSLLDLALTDTEVRILAVCRARFEQLRAENGTKATDIARAVRGDKSDVTKALNIVTYRRPSAALIAKLARFFRVENYADATLEERERFAIYEVEANLRITADSVRRMLNIREERLSAARAARDS